MGFVLVVSHIHRLQEMMKFAIHLVQLQMMMDIQNISMVDTMNQHTFAVNVLADLRPMLCPTAMQTIDNDPPKEMSVHVAEFQVLIPMMTKMDILAMINAVAVTMVAVVTLYSIAYVNDVSGDFVAFVVSLKFLVCDAVDICSLDVLSYGVPCDKMK